MASGQELIGVPGDEVCHPLIDDQKLYQAYLQNPILEQQIDVLKAQVSNLEKEKGLMQREIDLEKRRGDIFEEAFQKEKDLTDRALKLAENKKSNVWETWGPLGIIAIIVTAVASVL